MFIAILALILAIIPGTNKHADVVVIPPMPQYMPEVAATNNAYWDALYEFTMIFDATEVKRAKNGAIMVKGIHSNSFKFAKKG